MFMPQLGLAEIVLRGSIMYLAMLAILRFLGRRQAGNFGRADLLVIIVIADAAQNGLGNYRSVTEGIVLVLTIVGWDYALDWLAFRYPALDKVLQPPPLKLIDKGRVLHRNLKAEMISMEDFLGQLREQGIDNINQVKSASLEGDGRVSVIRFEETKASSKRGRSTGPTPTS
jgi:uncharacterized membrane protein YcaP (DUF421 family)